MEEEAEECSTNSDSKDSKEVEESGDAVPELLNISRTRCRIDLETKVIQRFPKISQSLRRLKAPASTVTFKTLF